MEVLVAIVVLSALMMGVAAFFVRGSGATTEMQRRQVASALGDQAMEQIRAVPAQAPQVAASAIVRGRTQTDVTASWTAALSSTPSLTPHLATMREAYDPSAVPADTEAVSYQSTARISDQNYTVRSFIGTCRRPAASPSTCVNNPTTLPSDQVMYRAVVQVTWTTGGKRSCSASSCQFVLASLIDPLPDQTFQMNTGASLGAAPVARDDNFSLPWGSDTSCKASTVPDWCYFSVKSNDSGTFGPAPITLSSVPSGPTGSPPGGTLRAGVASTSATGPVLTTTSPATNGTMTYVPRANWCGPEAFVYRLTDRAVPARSADATVTLMTACPTPVLKNGGGNVDFCSITPEDEAVLNHSPFPGWWPMYKVEMQPTSWAGTVTRSPTEGSVRITAASTLVGSGPWTVAVKITYPDGQQTTANLQLKRKGGPTC